ncbi:hypothetical protein [Streptomyces luteocolor]|uniref:hypothetical protein n=1 Tax=Streptomyces luteocolor TaxID=285500 RepID=UPI000852BD4D|nr:hypothetical protein [Streptomyces luteocolor]
MPAYLIVHADRRGDDPLIEDENLTVEFDAHWVTFSDAAGPCFVAPREGIRAVVRVDPEEDPLHEGPAPQKE